VHELRPGVWHWQAPHPEWDPSEPWREVVSSHAIDDGERLLVFDPIAPPSELLELAGSRDTAIVLTGPWHERDSQMLVEALGVPVYTPAPDKGSPDVAWLLVDHKGEGHVYAVDGDLPPGIDAAFTGRQWNDLVLWIERVRALVIGDTLADFGNGLEIPETWVSPRETRAQVAERLRPVLDLPIDIVFAAHAEPAGPDALERALSS
jgi:hypothetical protein